MRLIQRILIVIAITLTCLSASPSVFADGGTGGTGGAVPIAYVDVSKSSEWYGDNIVVTIVTRSYFIYPDGHMELLFESTEILVVPAPQEKFMLI